MVFLALLAVCMSILQCEDVQHNAALMLSYRVQITVENDTLLLDDSINVILHERTAFL